MRKKKSVEQELNLNENRPLTGETRRFTTGEAIFFAPKPLPTARIDPHSWGSSNQVLDINDTYMDIGQSNQGKAFQVKVIMAPLMVMTILVAAVLLYQPSQLQQQHGGYIGALIALFDAEECGLTPEEFPIASRIFCLLPESEGGGVMLIYGGIVLFCLWIIIHSSIQKARTRPLRFHRQRREVCHYPRGRRKPEIVPWEEVVCWVSGAKTYTGSSMVSGFTFGLAFPMADGEDYWIYKIPVSLVNEGQRLWEIMRCYMEEPSEYWAQPAEEESRRSFDKERRQLHINFHNFASIRQKFFTCGEAYTSYGGMVGYYLYNILCGWKLPYFISELDAKFSMAKFPREIEAWSQPLSQEQWAKPSEELLKQKALAKAHYEQGGNLEGLYEKLKAMHQEEMEAK